MISILRHQTYRRLFAAQELSLVGTGLATVALALIEDAFAGAWVLVNAGVWAQEPLGLAAHSYRTLTVDVGRA